MGLANLKIYLRTGKGRRHGNGDTNCIGLKIMDVVSLLCLGENLVGIEGENYHKNLHYANFDFFISFGADFGGRDVQCESEKSSPLP